MTDWTADSVESRLIEAARTLNCLPEQRIQGYYTLWPQITYEFGDLVGQEPPRLKRPIPSPAAISRMEQTLTWLPWLPPDLSKLLWLRAEGSPWKPICWRFGISRATAHRRHDYGLCLIAWRLNGKQPGKRSMAQIVEGARNY